MKFSTQLLVSTVAMATLMIAGCPTGGAGGGTDTDSLTTAEKTAIADAAVATQQIIQTTQVAQAPAAAEEEQAGQSLIDSLDPNNFPGEVNFGTCPNIQLTNSNDGVRVFDITIDFGAGCEPMFADGAEYAGVASGTFNQGAKSLSVGFDQFTVNGDSLDGSIAATYDVEDPVVSFDVTWNLTGVTVDEGELVTTGTGAGSYNTSTYVSTISSFVGTLTDQDFDFAITMSGVVSSFATYERFMPYAGQVTVEGQDIRTISVRFDQNSPATGVVEIKIGAGPWVEYNLYVALEQTE